MKPNGLSKPAACNTCYQEHSPLEFCRHDALVKAIERQKKSLASLHRANIQAVDTARAFQEVIREITPAMLEMRQQADSLRDILAEVSALDKSFENGVLPISLGVAIEERLKTYKTFTDGQENGTTDVQAETQN